MATRDFEYVAASFLSRLFVAVLLLFAGINKFIMGYGTFVDALTGQFAESWFPQVLVSSFAFTIPVIEVVLGLLLLVGLWSQMSLLASGVLFVLFAAGNMILGNGETVAQIGIYILVTVLALYLHGYDDWRMGS